MMNTATAAELSAPAERDDFYRDVLGLLNEIGLPYLVGGAYAFVRVTGIGAATKDLDLFIRRPDCERIMEAIAARGYRTEIRFPHWLAKVRSDAGVIDLIFDSGNGCSSVDDEWIANGIPARLLGVDVRLCPVEEMIWTKAFVMERERYDGADVAHLICARAEQIDWQRLMRRFGDNLAVLLSHLILFCFVYPSERGRLPDGLLDEVIDRVRTQPARRGDERLCRGGLLSRAQYLVDLTDWGYEDVRLPPHGNISAAQLQKWTEAAPDHPYAARPEDCE